MEEEIARKDIAITCLSGRVKSHLEQNLQYCAGEFKEANDEVKYLEVCASVIGKKVQLVRERLLMNSVDMNSASRKAEKTYVNYSPEISKISGLFSAMGVWKKQRDRQQAFRLDDQDKVIDDKITMESIMSYGKSGMGENIPGILEGGNHTSLVKLLGS